MAVFKLLQVQAGLLSWASIATSDSPAGKLLGASDVVPLKPLIINPTTEYVADSSSHLIHGLLGRQLCQSGYDECDNPGGRCCPVDGTCCSGNGCCGAGDWCYGGGCCQMSQNGCAGNSCCDDGFNCCKGGGCCASGENCVTISGKQGCCPNGQICSTSGGGECSDPGYVPCSGFDFCCPPGSTCSENMNYQPICSEPGSGGSGVPGGTLNPTTSSSFSSVSVTSSSSTYTTQPATAISSPVPSQGSENIIVQATDDRIDYSGIGWAWQGSTCNSTATSRKCVGNLHSLTFTFEGSAVYLLSTRNSDAGIYSVTYENETVTQDGYISASTAECGFTWAKTDLGNGTHTVVVNALGKSPSASSSSNGSFELNSFLIVETNDPTPTASSNNGPTNSSSRVDRNLTLGIFIGMIIVLFMCPRTL